MKDDSAQRLIDELHTTACAQGASFYTDPANGYAVFTAVALKRNRSCCGCGCRHCPFGHMLVPAGARDELVTDPWMEENADDSSSACDILFWSGGKDAYLALRRLQRENARPVILLTTYDGRTERVAHQDVDLDTVRTQAETLALDHMLVPLFPHIEYIDRVTLAIRQVVMKRPVHRVVFGDLHLEHIRQWRVDNLGPRLTPHSIQLCFPLWQVPYTELMDEMFREDVDYVVSAVTSERCAPHLRVGDHLTPAVLQALPTDIDRFGENGEFHTAIRLRTSSG
ncbi:MAG: DUF5522 domain-containing protein [Myxococcota bacterium]|nr:DUF5522 domain-containing protein [Myxococcota bacterium]